MKACLFFYTASLILSLALTWVTIRLGRWLALTDSPDVRKVHREPVPRIGGLAIYVTAVCAGLLAFGLLRRTDDLTQQSLAKIPMLLLGATMAFLLGLVDDIHALRARVKLLVQLVAAALMCAAGIRIGSIVVGEWSPIPLHWLAWPVTILWIVGITNAVNLSDGVDGLAATVAMVACGVIALLAFRSSQALIGTLMLAVLGALTGFLCFNFHPAQIFMGDSGSLFVGFVISTASVLCFMKSHAFVGLALPAVALGIPILDTMLSMLRRFVARRPMFAPDQGHFHHRLLQRGLGQQQTVGIICAATLVGTCLGIWMLFADAQTSLVLCGMILVFLLGLFHAASVIRPGTVIAGLKSRLHIVQERHEEICEFCSLQLQFERAEDPSTWWQALCQTADRLDFAWVSIDVADHEGNTQSHVWRRPTSLPQGSRLTIVKVPVQMLLSNQPLEVEVAVLTNGSVEGATRRASLLGRLLDEYKMPALGPGVRQFGTTAPGVPRNVDRLLPVDPPVASRLNVTGKPFGQTSERRVLRDSRPPMSEARTAHA